MSLFDGVFSGPRTSARRWRSLLAALAEATTTTAPTLGGRDRTNFGTWRKDLSRITAFRSNHIENAAAGRLFRALHPAVHAVSASRPSRPVFPTHDTGKFPTRIARTTLHKCSAPWVAARWKPWWVSLRYWASPMFRSAQSPGLNTPLPCSGPRLREKRQPEWRTLCRRRERCCSPRSPARALTQRRCRYQAPGGALRRRSDRSSRAFRWASRGEPRSPPASRRIGRRGAALRALARRCGGRASDSQRQGPGRRSSRTPRRRGVSWRRRTCTYKGRVTAARRC